MRPLLVCLALLAGCSLYLEDKHKPPHTSSLPDAPADSRQDCGPAPADAGSCQCVYDTWRCNSCPWPNPEPVIACAQVGATCDYEDWEHGCDCRCDESGYWACIPQTSGSQCPAPPPPDAAL